MELSRGVCPRDYDIIISGSIPEVCPDDFPTHEKHTESDHGDVCRNDNIHGLNIGSAAFLAPRAVPGALILETVLDTAVPHHDAQQVLLDGLLGQRHDVRGPGGTFGPHQDLSGRDVNLGMKVVLSPVLSSLYYTEY